VFFKFLEVRSRRPSMSNSAMVFLRWGIFFLIVSFSKGEKQVWVLQRSESDILVNNDSTERKG
jgi:hypothetical protein